MIHKSQRKYWFALCACASIADVLLPISSAEEPAVVSGGPDVIVTAITGVSNYDSETPPGEPEPIDAFSVGTISCNAGDATLILSIADPQHYILRQGMFRLKGDRFEQIGTSWVKHIFPASNEPGTCGLNCVNPNISGPELRPGCTDSNSAGINGDRVYSTRCAFVNPYAGTFPWPTGLVHAEGPIEQRIQVHHSDLNPALNQGASYFVEAHYIHPDDAMAGNADNNATFARVTLSDPGTGTYVMTITSPALNRGQTKPAVLAWQDADASVTVTNVRVPEEGLFIVAAKASNIGGGIWHFEYAIENLNSERAGRWFQVPYPTGAQIQNVGFHDVDYHSGELQAGTDWTKTVLGEAVVWTMDGPETGEIANALRWSTVYNFRFDANVGPAPTTAALGLFSPGTPMQVEFQTIGPALGFMDCNGNDRLDGCDVNCTAAPVCPPPCGMSDDCNGNGLPDECETDCNGNHSADTCDVTLRCVGGADAGEPCVVNAECTSNVCRRFSEDCNGNDAPDECDPDCDEDGIIDDCETVQDADSDGSLDCVDQCQFSTPPGACEPPSQITCKFPNGSCFPYPRHLCVGPNYTVYCGEPGVCEGDPCPDTLCREGCQPGDYDGDADHDLRDFGAFTVCFTGEPEAETPTDLCLSRFDIDDDADIDLTDFYSIHLYWQNWNGN